MDDADELKRLETSLWQPETRFDRTYMESIFSPDFLEFGRSGRTYRGAETLSFEPSDIDVE
jgi:hypothetical protein